MPNKTLHRVDIFISSPSDVRAEREAALRAIERLNRLASIRAKYVLNPLRYEQEVPPASGAPAQIIVDEYMSEPQDSFIVLCIMWSRMGTPFTHPTTGESFESGTQYEFVMAYRSQQQQGTPHVLLYRNVSPNPQADPAQAEKVDAFFKQFHGNEAVFKGLYQTYTDVKDFEEYVFHHIEKILVTHPPEQVALKLLDHAARPTLIEAPRRLDAALPQDTYLNQPTELWAQICLPQSRGFRDKLPHATDTGDIIDQQDVREGALSIAFPVDEATQRAQPVTAFLEITAPDFRVTEPRQTLLISPEFDSGTLVFSLTPITARKRSLVHVKLSVTTSDGYPVTVGSVTLYTEIQSHIAEKIGKLLWSVAVLPLGIVGLTRRGNLPAQGEWLDEGEDDLRGGGSMMWPDEAPASSGPLVPVRPITSADPVIHVKTVGGAPKTEAVDLSAEGILTVNLRAASVNRMDANQELLAYLAGLLSVGLEALDIRRGEFSGDKFIAVEGLTTQDIETILRKALEK